MLPTSHYDKAKADYAVKFIESMRHTKGKWAGKRFWLFPWQEQIVRDVFGIVDERGKRQFRTAFVEIGKKNGIEVHDGVFIQLTGPQYETASEIRMYKALGADCCGMSSAVEAIAANHMGMKVCGINCITNMSTGISKTKLSGEEVIEIANKVSGNFEKLVSELVREIKK